ncbi:hypothetical protein [Spiroplasma endosymbiont of Lasioglossum villosulum]|uniref:hypothetical protein n=1 Tax=Spiroplasma endosymbiont of Lasioglossum villosulum TaxID=3066320 RepID=UPI0030CAB381
MRKNFEKSTTWNLLPQTFKKQWTKQINIIKYLTNESGNNNDLLISFGIIPYQEQNELPFIKLNIEDSYDLDFSHNNAIGNTYDSVTQTFNDSCFSNEVTIRQTIYGINANSNNFIKPNLINSKFKNFINMNSDTMNTSDFWLDKEFTKNVNNIKKQLHITSINAPNVTFLPIVASNAQHPILVLVMVTILVKLFYIHILILMVIKNI